MSPPSPLSRAATMEDFHKAIDSFKKESQKARVSRISAEELSSVVDRVLSKVERVV